MNYDTRKRLFGFNHAFDHPVTLGITVAVVAALVATPLIFLWLSRRGKINPGQRAELMKTYKSWLVIIPLMGLPVLAGAAWTMLAVAVLSLLCYQEFARATGLFREKLISFTVVVGILMITFAVVDHWYGFFMALGPLTVATIAMVAILPDQPKGYIQRVALGVLGFLLFGSALGHLGYIANDQNFRPILFMILLAVEANDVFAYMTGKTLGRSKLAPNTSPNKTIAGSLGALVLTTALTTLTGYFVFAGTVLDSWPHLVVLGIIISVMGQFGDLMLSSVKRDLGIKDMGTIFPGHGGLLDRFDSLILVAPAVFHYVNYFVGIGDEYPHVLTGG